MTKQQILADLRNILHVLNTGAPVDTVKLSGRIATIVVSMLGDDAILAAEKGEKLAWMSSAAIAMKEAHELRTQLDEVRRSLDALRGK